VDHTSTQPLPKEMIMPEGAEDEVLSGEASYLEE